MTPTPDTLDDILDKLWWAGVGSANMDDIEDADDRDKALLNSQKHYTAEAKQALTAYVQREVVRELKELKTKQFWAADDAYDVGDVDADGHRGTAMTKNPDHICPDCLQFGGQCKLHPASSHACKKRKWYGEIVHTREEPLA